jgi:hypothetical protein
MKNLAGEPRFLIAYTFADIRTQFYLGTLPQNIESSTRHCCQENDTRSRQGQRR